MKRRFRNFDEGGEVDDPRRRGFLRDSQGNPVRSGTGEPVRTGSEYSYEDYRRDNPEQVREDEEKAKQTAAEIRQRMQRAAEQVRPPAAQPPAGPTPPAGQTQVFAPLGGVPPASSASRPPGAMPPASPPGAMPPAGMPPMQMGDASVAQEMAQRGPQAAPPTPTPPTPATPTPPTPRPQIAKPKTPRAVSSGRGKAAGKTAEQELQAIVADKKRQQERERMKKMEREQALEGVYPETYMPPLRGVQALAGMAAGKAAGQAAGKAAPKAARAEPKVPSDLGAKPRAERTFASEARTGGRELAQQAESGSKAVAKRAEPAPAKIAERAKDRGFVPGERRALEGRKPGQLQEARQGESRREKYMGPAQEVRRELPKPATKQAAKPQRKKPRRDDDDDLGRFAGESPSFMKKGGMVRRGDGIAQRGKTRGKYI